MKIAFVFLLMIIVLVVCCQGGFHKKKKGGKSWYKKWEKYNKETQYCCKHYRYGKCRKGYVYDKMNCTGRPLETAPDYCNCQKYYECHYDKATLLHCPVGGAWTNDASSPACLKLYNPKQLCGKRRYKPKKYVPRFIKIKVIIRDSTVSPADDLDMFYGVAAQGPIYNMLLSFAATRSNFTFQTYYVPITWMHLKCMNGKCKVRQPVRTHWNVKHNGKSLEIGEGICTYIPKNGDTILFDLAESTNKHSSHYG